MTDKKRIREMWADHFEELGTPSVSVRHDNDFLTPVTTSVKATFDLNPVQSALSDLLSTSATHGTFFRTSTKRGLILIGLELNTNARESFEHCCSYSLNLSIDQHVCQFIS